MQITRQCLAAQARMLERVLITTSLYINLWVVVFSLPTMPTLPTHCCCCCCCCSLSTACLERPQTQSYANDFTDCTSGGLDHAPEQGTASCKEGFLGSYTATCNNGNWEYTTTTTTSAACEPTVGEALCGKVSSAQCHRSPIACLSGRLPPRQPQPIWAVAAMH
jgi:hypothetical protein